jgi:acetyl esterase/lipase
MKTLNRLSLIISFFLFASLMQAQQKIIPIWPGAAPGSESWTYKEVQYLNEQNQQMVRNVVSPTLTAYFPDPAKSTGTAVIIAPGGGFRFLSWQTEGTEVAEWLAAHGVTAFVLKYRVMYTGETKEEFQKALMVLFAEISASQKPENTGKPEGNLNNSKRFSDAELMGIEDGKQAIWLIRKQAAKLGIKPNRIGIMGFSAGGMVTIGAALSTDPESRPDFAGAIYAPWSGGTVPANAPPLFILAAADDKLASPGSIMTYNEWKGAGRDAELHIYSKGGHGFGMQKKGLPADTWIERFGDWMQSQGLMNNIDMNAAK